MIPFVLALGLQNAPVILEIHGVLVPSVDEGSLDSFAADPVGDGSVRALTWYQLDGARSASIDQLALIIRDAMDAAQTIRFNLAGMDGIAYIAADPRPSHFRPPSTNWELATVLSNPSLRAKTRWYEGPGLPVSFRF
jgi:hypothetical protein